MTIETKYKWDCQEFHPAKLCFFCKKHEAQNYDCEELYKVIRNTTGFPGYVVNYTKVSIPIPICLNCYSAHRKIEKRVGILNIIVWLITTGIASYWLYDPVDGLFFVLSYLGL